MTKPGVSGAERVLPGPRTSPAQYRRPLIAGGRLLVSARALKRSECHWATPPTGTG